MTSIRLLLTSTVAAFAVVAGLGTAPSALAAGDPVAAAKAGPLSAGVKQLVREGPADAKTLTRPNGDVVLNVRLADISPASTAALREAGARIRFTDAGLRTVTISIDPADIPALAGITGVQSVTQVLRPLTNAACPTGRFVSEAFAQLRSELAAADFHVTGRDVTVGILSDSFDARGGQAQDVADGELPGTGNPCGHAGSVANLLDYEFGDDEGRAMAQLVHDLAPDAQIQFASAFYSPEGMAASIRALADAGADVIVDDITWLNEPMYQDGVIGKAVEDVTAQGVTYFSSAANSNLILDGTNVASYETLRFRATDCPAAINAKYGARVSCHDFNPGLGSDPTYGLQYQDAVLYDLGWSEPQFGVTDDLDLCLLDGAGSVLTCSQENNLTTQQAFELVYAVTFGLQDGQIVVVRYAGTGAPRFKLISLRSQLTAVEYGTSRGTDVVGPTTFGHNASRSGATVAAVEYNNPDALEWYSSWGPATYCWGPVQGTEPASPLQPCDTATVDLTATDGVQNSFFGEEDAGIHRFYGTSAAAPHAAAVAALMLDREPCLAPAEILDAMKSTGRPVGQTPANGAGGGLLDARAALAAIGAKQCDKTPPRVTVQSSAQWASSAATVTISAADRRTVSSIDCDQGRLEGLTGIGSPTATARVVVDTPGETTVTCDGTDAEGNHGAAQGSANTATVKIDRTAPVLTCRPATLYQGQAGFVTADVSDTQSGAATPTSSVSVPTQTPGRFSVTVTGKDAVGNTGTSICGYTVSPTPDTSAPVLTCRPLTLAQGHSGLLVADVSDVGSGPLTPTVSVSVTGTLAGTFSLALTARDKAGNSTTATCPYRVTASKAMVRGRGHVAAKSRGTYTATGFPAASRLTWTLRHRGTTVARETTRTTAAGTATTTVRFPLEAGRYTVKATSADVSAFRKVRVH